MSGRFYWHHGLFFDYKKTAQDFQNTHFDNGEWHIEENWYVFVRFPLARKWLECGTSEFYYDGHTQESFTFFFIEVGKGYSYDSRPIEMWDDDK